MPCLLFPLFAADSFAKSLTSNLSCVRGELNMRQFPDGETYLQFVSKLNEQDCIFIATLNKPNEKIAPLLFAAATAKELGAKKIGLIVPYLSYMRQDKRFHTGEALTSQYFAQLLSNYFDWLITVDPHLHRYHTLNEIYTIPTTVLHATIPMAQWVKTHGKDCFLIGPDEESKQWVSEVAHLAQVPFIILEKIRTGDREVTITLPDVKAYQHLKPILIDDIISTGKTLIKATQLLIGSGLAAPICLATHAVFAGNAYQELLAAGVKQVVTCNTIEHSTNQIDVAALITQEIIEYHMRAHKAV